MNELLARLPELASAHARLCLAALTAGLAIGLPLGLLLHRRPRARGATLAVIGVAQTIPSLALLAFMVPALAALGALLEPAIGMRISSIGVLPAFIALTLYGLLPVLRNTVTGLGGVEPNLVEAARGVGMSERQVLLRVELPLALPVIAAGVRTAAVWTVGTAVLATPVGASSLGDYIFVGLQTQNHASVAVGCLGSAVLALVLDATVHALEVLVTPPRPGWRSAAGAKAIAGLVSLSLLAFAPLLGGRKTVDARIGAKAFTEGLVLADLVAARLERVGLRTDRVGSLGSSVAFDALASGDIDAYVDYSGTVLANEMHEQPEPGHPERVLPRVRAWLRAEHDIEVGAVLGFQNRYAFALPAEKAEALGVKTLSDLARVAPDLSVVASYEFFERPEWPAVRDMYGMRFERRRTMEQALAYRAVEAGEVDVMVAYSTDAMVDRLDLRLLEDDRGAIPPYDAIVLLRGAFAREHPRAAAAVERLEGRLDEALVRKLNRAVDEAHRSPGDVAAETEARLDREPQRSAD